MPATPKMKKVSPKHEAPRAKGVKTNAEEARADKDAKGGGFKPVSRLKKKEK